MRYSRFGLCIMAFASLVIAGSVLFAANPTFEVKPFGSLEDGTSIFQVSLDNGQGMRVSVINYGATITEVMVPDAKGQVANVVLGSNSLSPYLTGFPAASVIGRYANRIHNAQFPLDGETIHVTKNSGTNHIHGGKINFAKVAWDNRENVAKDDRATATFTYHSVDGEEGFPGNLDVTVNYSLTVNNELRIEYSAVTDKPTVVNLTNHAYFNLSGPGGDVLGHELQIHADKYTMVDAKLIPTGEIAPVESTPLDFRQPHTIGERIAELEATRGYDHNYVLGSTIPGLRLIAHVKEPTTGRSMQCLTTEPGVQLYTGNHFNVNPFPKHGGFCLETQHYPNSPNQAEFPTTIVRPGDQWSSTTVFRFSH